MTRTTYYMASTDPEAPNTYSQAAHARERSLYLPNGIYDEVGNNLVVDATDPASMAITVDTGAITINGYTCECTALEELAISAAHATLPRIDRVVARLDVAVTPGISFEILTGAPAETPTVPTLTQTAYIYEIALAQIEVAAGVTSVAAEDIVDERVYGDITNLFHAAVEMLSDLAVDGDLDVAGEVRFAGSVAFEGGVVADLTGDVSGYIKRVLKITTSPGIFALGDIIPAKTESNTGTSLSGDIATGIVARTAAFAATDQAFGIFKNLGFGSEIPYNVVVTVYHNSTLSWTITTKNSLGTTIQTYSGSGSQSIDVTVQVTAETDTISYTISSPYSNSSSASIAAYSASFD